MKSGLPFGEYEYTNVLRFTGSGVPVSIAFAWAGIVVCGVLVSRAQTRIGRALEVGVVALWFDLVLDCGRCPRVLDLEGQCRVGQLLRDSVAKLLKLAGACDAHVAAAAQACDTAAASQGSAPSVPGDAVYVWIAGGQGAALVAARNCRRRTDCAGRENPP